VCWVAVSLPPVRPRTPRQGSRRITPPWSRARGSRSAAFYRSALCFVRFWTKQGAALSAALAFFRLCLQVGEQIQAKAASLSDHQTPARSQAATPRQPARTPRGRVA
jgi:hypothetical protein